MTMKKWALAAAALFLTSVGNAQVDCVTSDNARCYEQSAPQTLPQEQQQQQPERAAASADGAGCENLGPLQRNCSTAQSNAVNSCGQIDKTALDKEKENILKKTEADGSSMKGICERIKAFNQKVKAANENVSQNCKNALKQCVDYCRIQVETLAQTCSSEAIASKNFEGFAVMCDRRQAGLDKDLNSYEEQMKKFAKENSCASTSASSEEDKKDDKEKTAEEKKKEDTDWSKLMSAGVSALGMLAGTMGQTTPTTGGVAPDGVTAQACMIEANFKTCECNIAYCTANQASVGSVGAVTNTGGAAVTANSEDIKLPAEPWMPGPGAPSGGEAAAASAGYAGGGGGGGGHANFTPDAPKGRGGSSLSADILAGVKGGGGGTASAAAVPGPRSFDGGPRDPEKLPGYALGAGIPTGTDIKNFMPPIPPSASSANRGISSELQGKIHPASAVGWNEISKRYRADTFLDPNLP